MGVLGFVQSIEETMADGPIIAWVSDYRSLVLWSRESRIVPVSGPAMSTRLRGTAARRE